jgi:uncharacterized protein (TIGR02268 family)
LSIPATLALVLVLLGGTLAPAQPAPTRESRRRSVTLTGNPLEVRIAKGIRTVLLFDVPIRGKAVEVDRARIKVVDTGERSIIIEALSEPRADERWTMRVPLADGKSPEVAEIALVSHLTEVDTELDIARREHLDTACQAAGAPCAAMGPADAVASGLIDERGVQTVKIHPFNDAASGFQSLDGMAYRARDWVLVEVEIRPPPGHPAWTPHGATLTSKTGEARVRGVKVQPSKQFPEERGRVLVETDVPPAGAGLEFVLELRGVEGAPSFSIPKVKLPPAQEGM